MDGTKANAIEALQHRGDEPHLLREVHRTYQVLISGFVRATGMPASRFAVLRLLASSEGEVGITDLARQLEINPAAVTRQVQDMERERLIARRPDGTDGRRSYVTLTLRGRKLFEKIHDRTHRLEQSLSSVVSAKEMREAAIVLAKLRTFLEGRR